MSYRRVSARVLASILCSAVLLTACAAAPTRGPVLAAVTPRDRTPSTSSPPVHYAAIEIEYRFDAAGNYVKRHQTRYRILDSDGVEGWSRLDAEWSPWYQPRPEVAARVWDPSGTAHQLDPRTLVEGAADKDNPKLYNDARSVGAPLPNVAVGSTVETRVIQRTSRPMFAGGMNGKLLVAAPWPIDSMKVIVDAPESLPLRLEQLDAKGRIQEIRSGGRRRLVFEGGPYPGLEALEPMQLPEVAAWPAVVFSTARDWHSVAAEFHSLAAPQLADPGVRDIARTIGATGATLAERVDKVLAWQRARVRYADVEFGGASIVPGRPSETIQRGYGDCKDQAALLVALLGHLDIPARLALLRTGPGEDVRPALPGIGMFDHAIVYIPGNPPLWVDPTATSARAGQTTFATQRRLALVIDPATQELTSTPMSPPSQNVYREVREVFLSEEGAGRVVETVTAEGAAELLLRDNYVDMSRSKVQTDLDNYVKNAYRSEKPATVELAPIQNIKEPFRLRIEAKESNVAFTGDDDAVAWLDDRAVFSMVPKALRFAEDRRTPMALHLPYHGEVRYRVVPPKGFSLREPLATPAIDLGPATFKREFRALPSGEFELVTRFELNAERLTAAEVNGFREKVRQFDDLDWLALRFDHAGAALQRQGKPREAFELYRNLLAAPSDPAREWRRYALALVRGSHVAAARDAARKAVELASASSDTHRVLGYVLLHDEFGRQFGEGYPRDQAIAESRKALELDPKDDAARVNLALAIHHDTSGAVSANQKDLEDALAEYDKIDPKTLTDFGGTNYNANPLTILLRLGRHREVVDRVKKLGAEGKELTHLRVTAVAALEGAARAIDEVARTGLDPEARASILGDASWQLRQIRRYPESGELLAAAARLSQHGSDYEGKRKATSNLRKVEVSSLSDRVPEELARKLLWTLATADTFGEPLASSLFSSRTARGAGSQRLQNFQKGYRIGQRRAARVWNASSPEAVADFGLAGQYSLESHAPVADLVRYTVGSHDLDIVVVREGTGYRALEVANTPRAVCTGALDAVRKGDQESARKWLDWAYDLAEKEATSKPWEASPLLVLWKKGQAGDVRVAAASWCATRDRAPDDVIPWLNEAAPKAGSPERQAAIQHALALAWLATSQPAKAAEATTHLLSQRPDFLPACVLHCSALGQLQRYNECRSAIHAQLSKRPNDADLVILLADLESQAGRFDASRAALTRWGGSAQIPAGVHGRHAWLGLFGTGISAEDLDHALKAAQSHDYGDPDTLMTLALAYADAGKTEEAIQTVRKAGDQAGFEPDSPVGWLVLGKVAEKHGLPEEARRSYGRVQKPAQQRADTAWVLAQQWLARLGR